MATATSVKTTCYFNGKLWKKGDTCNFTIPDTSPFLKHFNVKAVATKTTKTETDESGGTTTTNTTKTK